MKLPRSFSYAEDAVKQTVKQSVSRGKVDVYISVAAAEDEAVNIRLNRPVLEGYLNALRTIAAEPDHRAGIPRAARGEDARGTRRNDR